jgi:hypothetical protein
LINSKQSSSILLCLDMVDLKSDEFNAIWDVIKNWDISAPDYYNGYSGANGSHVKLLLDALKLVLRNKKNR